MEIEMNYTTTTTIMGALLLGVSFAAADANKGMNIV